MCKARRYFTIGDLHGVPVFLKVPDQFGTETDIARSGLLESASSEVPARVLGFIGPRVVDHRAAGAEQTTWRAVAGRLADPEWDLLHPVDRLRPAGSAVTLRPRRVALEIVQLILRVRVVFSLGDFALMRITVPSD